MSREWKPGDVALVTDATGELRTMIQVQDSGSRCWHGVYESGDLRCLDASQAQDARPLVVIDPEDHLMAVLLMVAFTSALGPETHVKAQDDAMQAALRSLIADPKPEEPLGLGAVVESADGKRYLRMDGRLAPWYEVGVHYADRPWRYFKDINAVTILSEGVTHE